MIPNQIIEQVLHFAKLELHESFYYDFKTAEAILEYENSDKNSHDENKFLNFFELFTLKKVYVTAHTDQIPSLLKILDVIKCVEDILLEKLATLCEYAKPTDPLTEVDEGLLGAKLEECDRIAHRITSCVSEICFYYNGWHQSQLPLKILRHMMFLSGSIDFELKVHQLMSNLLLHIQEDDEIGTLSFNLNNPLSSCFKNYEFFTNLYKIFFQFCDQDAFKFQEKIVSSRNNKSFEDFETGLLIFIGSRPAGKIFIYKYENILKSICDLDWKDKRPFFLIDWLSRLIPPSHEEIFAEEIALIAAYSKFITLILDETVSSEAIASLAYTQYINAELFRKLVFKNEQDLTIEPVANWGVQELKKAINYAEDPKKVLSSEFDLIINGLLSVSQAQISMIKGLDLKNSKAVAAVQSLLDFWFSPQTPGMYTLLSKLHENREEILNIPPRAGSPLDSSELIYSNHFRAILKIIDDHQDEKKTLIQRGVENHPILNYSFFTPELRKLLENESNAAIKSRIDTFGLIIWTEVERFSNEWLMQDREAPEFSKKAVIQLQNTFEDLQSIEKTVDKLYSKHNPPKNPAAMDCIFLCLHSQLLTKILLTTNSLEFTEMDRLVHAIKLNETLAFFEGLKQRLSSKKDELTFKVACYYFAFYSELCSIIQITKLQRDKQDNLLSVKQYEKLSLLAIFFYDPDLCFIGALSRILLQAISIEKDHPSYVRTLHKTGYMEFYLKEPYGNVKRKEFVHVETLPDNYIPELTFEEMKVCLYDQLIKDCDFDAVAKVIRIFKARVTDRAKALKSQFRNFEEMKNIGKYRCISDFSLLCALFKTYIQVLGDLSEQSIKTPFSEDPAARKLMRNIEDGMLASVNIFLSLPFINREPSILKCFINLLAHSAPEKAAECMKELRIIVNLRFNVSNHKLISEKIILSLVQRMFQPRKIIKLRELMLEMAYCEVGSDKRVHLFELEALMSFLDSLEIELKIQFSNKLTDKKLFIEDLQILEGLRTGLIEDFDSRATESGPQIVISKMAGYYFKYFDLCYNHHVIKITETLTEKLQSSIKSCCLLKNGDDEKKRLIPILFNDLSLLISYSLYLFDSSSSQNQQVLASIREFLTNTSTMSTVMKGFACLEDLITNCTTQDGYFQNIIPEIKVIKLVSRYEFKEFWDAFTDKELLRVPFVSRLFESPEQKLDSKDTENFLKELVLVASCILKTKLCASIGAPTVQSQEFHEKLVRTFLRFQREVINLAFFSSIKISENQELIDSFYLNVFHPLLELCKSSSSSDARATWIVLAKFSTLKQESLDALANEIENYKELAQGFSSAERLRNLVKAEINLAEGKQIPSNDESFSSLLSSFLRHFNGISGIIDSNTEQLMPCSSALSEINITVCNTMYEVFKTFDPNAINIFFQRKLKKLDYRLFCRFPVETISSSRTIFKKICKIDGLPNTQKSIDQKLIDEIYNLSVSLLEPSQKLEVFDFKATDDVSAILLNLFTLFEHSPEKFEHFIESEPTLIYRIVENASSTESSFWLFYLLVKTLSLECNINDSMLMHTISQGLKKLNMKSFAGDLNNNLFDTFYSDIYHKVLQEILDSLSTDPYLLLSSLIKDVPYINPEKLTLSKTAENSFKFFIRVMEFSLSKTQQLSSLVTVIASLVPLCPQIVVLLANYNSEKLLPKVNNSILTSLLQKAPSSQTAKKQSFLSSLLQTFVDRREEGLLMVLLNALVDPQMKSLLVLYQKELLPSASYHRILVSSWLIESFDELDLAKPKPKDDNRLQLLISAVNILFRDVHTLTKREIDAYYSVCDKFCELLIFLPQYSDQQRGELHKILFKCFEPFKNMEAMWAASTYLGMNYPDILVGYNPQVIQAILLYIYDKIPSDYILKPIEDQKLSLETTKLKLRPKPLEIAEKQQSLKPDFHKSLYVLTDIFLSRKILSSHILSETENLDSKYFSSETEIQYILSNLPLNSLNLKKSEEEFSESKTPSKRNELYENLVNQVAYHPYSETKVSKAPSFAYDFTPEEFLPGPNSLEELASLSKIVSAKFQKHFEPIFEQQFEKHLKHRNFSLLEINEKEADLNNFMQSLTTKELIAFILCADSNIFTKLPQYFRTILSGLREKTKALLQEKGFYEQLRGSNIETSPVNNKLNQDTVSSTRLEHLLASFNSSNSKPTQYELFNELESSLIRKIDFNISASKKHDPIPNPQKTMKLGTASKFYNEVFTILDNHLQNFPSNKPNKTPLATFHLPSTLLEKLILPLAFNPTADWISILFDLTFNPLNEIRFLDLMLRILAIPANDFVKFLAKFENYFKFKFVTRPTTEQFKNNINQAVTFLLSSQTREITAYASFDGLIAQVESQWGTLPLKQKILELSTLKYSGGKSFAQEYIDYISANKLSHSEQGKVLIPMVIQYLESNPKDNCQDDAFIKYFFELCSKQENFHVDFFKLSLLQQLYIAKNPLAFNLILKIFRLQVNIQRIKFICGCARDITAHLKNLISNKQGFSIKGAIQEFEKYQSIIEYLTNMWMLAIFCFKRVTERLNKAVSMTRSQRDLLHSDCELLGKFITKPQITLVFDICAEHLEQIEEILAVTRDHEIEAPSLKFINLLCNYEFVFYMLQQMRQEFERLISIDQELSNNLALLKVQSKVSSENIQKLSLLKLEHTWSQLMREGVLLSPDEVMFRLSSKCNRVFKAYLNMEQEMYTSMIFNPWVIPQNLRLEFIRKNLDKTDNSELRKFYLRREAIVEDTLLNFEALNANEINPNLKLVIEFIGEPGVDEGGVTTEWASQILKTLADPKNGLFQISANKVSVQPSPISVIVPNSQKYYRLIGRVIGYVIANRISVSVNFTKPMLKQLLGVRLTALDLADIDPDLSSRLQWMLQNQINAEDLSQEFSFGFSFLDKLYTIDLSGDHSTQLVDEDNKMIFVKQLVYHKLIKPIQEPINQISLGILDFVPFVYFRLLTPADLHSLLAGESSIDLAEMKKYAKILQPAPSEDMIKWFWEILEDIGKDQLASFLFFVTGNSMVGFGGFKDHPISLQRDFKSSESLPVSHTCFSIIDLPEYPSKEKFKEKLLKAINEGQGFYLA